MAPPGVVVLFSQSRVANSDGSYTDQKVFKVEKATPAYLTRLAHDLGRIPDWIRVTRLAFVDTRGPIVATSAYLDPEIKGTLADGRFVWQDVLVVTPVDTAQEIIFAAYNNDADDAYFLVEFGITQSKAK